MEYKQEVKTTIKCSCGRGLDLWTNPNFPGTLFDCDCGKTYLFEILETSRWTPTCVTFCVTIEEQS